MHIDRRKTRSDFRDLALRFWLCATAERGQLDGLVLADQAGLLIAASMPQRAAEEVAAQAPYLAGHAELLNAVMGNDAFPLTVHELSLSSQPIYICGVGRPIMDNTLIQDVQSGVQRIFANAASLPC